MRASVATFVTSCREWRDAFKVKWKLNEKTSIFPLPVPGRKRLWLLVCWPRSSKARSSKLRNFETTQLEGTETLRSKPRLMKMILSSVSR